MKRRETPSNSSKQRKYNRLHFHRIGLIEPVFVTLATHLIVLGVDTAFRRVTLWLNCGGVLVRKEVIRARIDGKIKEEAAAVLAEIGLAVPDAFRLMMMRIAAEKRLPFEPLIPNEETVEAMEAARRGDLVTVGGLSDLVADLNTDD